MFIIGPRSGLSRATSTSREAMAAVETVHGIHDMGAWNSKLAESSGKLVVVDFTATWCGPCKMMAPIFAEYSKAYSNAIFLKVDVDEMAQIAVEWKVEAMPTFMFIKDGKCVDKLVGADKKQLEAKIKAHV